MKKRPILCRMSRRLPWDNYGITPIGRRGAWMAQDNPSCSSLPKPGRRVRLGECGGESFAIINRSGQLFFKRWRKK